MAVIVIGVLKAVLKAVGGDAVASIPSVTSGLMEGSDGLSLFGCPIMYPLTKDRNYALFLVFLIGIGLNESDADAPLVSDALEVQEDAFGVLPVLTCLGCVKLGSQCVAALAHLDVGLLNRCWGLSPLVSFCHGVVQ